MAGEDNSMEARFKIELKDRNPADVDDLVLDHCKATEISGIDDAVNVESLSLLGVGLTSLNGLPKLSKLIKLDLSNNKISGGLEVLTVNCPNLVHLNLSSNEIESCDALEPLGKLANLCELDLFSNNINTDDPTERSKIFKIIPSLQILDGCDETGEEIEDDISDEEASGEDNDDEEEEDDGPGLSYLDNSQLDEDETEDYEPTVKVVRGKKRGIEEASADEPEAKKKEESA